ncbi:STAS domain-containing protein [Mycobacterium vicinigordonae]|uniref:STAS domain-containing protein n=1 Tax=Mycobacterium vicinigordonae TaxID=1719132 RepID=A0A7D6IT34_9MYCO|nr:STAS domain-containing protein [Mycobacterium vicinigordonae]QLL08199.1 STAS domain-containing protein [Mycobacterium vicinigordonae]
MTTAITPPVRGNGTVECSGAFIRAHCRHLATVVTLRGEVDAVNVDQVSRHVRRFVDGTNPLVLDLSELTHFSTAGISLLCALDEECRAADVEWTVVTNPTCAALLGNDAGESPFPVSRSVHQALRSLADAISWRRQSVLSLVKKSA